jgi:hypothetical protein
MSSQLLGKKRPTKDTEDEDQLSKLKRQKHEDNNSNSESEEEKPKKTLFGDSAPTKPGLFGNLEEKKDDKPKLFTDKGTSNIFSSSSIFSNTGSSLFSTNTTTGGGLFSGQKLFDFGSLNKDNTSFFTKQEAKKSDDEEGEEGDDDVLQGSESPNAYNPTILEKKDEKSDFVKKFVRHIDNILVHNKEDNKFVSKGSGFVSIEYTEVHKKSAFVVFRYF